jgi:predicted nucleic acid-binding protein
MRYFIDTNLIIYFFDYGYDFKISKKKNEPNVKRENYLNAKNKLEPILNDSESEIFINRLVYLEALRIITDPKKYDYLKSVLENIAFVEIYPEFYEQAIELSKYCTSKGINIKGRCAAIDFLHFTTAKYYDLHILANDGDIEKLTQAYIEWLKSTQLPQKN